MVRKTAPSRQQAQVYPSSPLASLPALADKSLPITESERALFAACFGRLIDRILAETSDA